MPTSSYLIEEAIVKTDYQVADTEQYFSVYITYVVTLAILLFNTLVQAVHIIRLEKNSETFTDKCKIYKLIDGKYPHFSFLNKIFINKNLVSDEDELTSVLEHERVHVKQKHSLDILFFELLKIVFWFNPFIWLFKKLAVENHEYLADRGMLRQTSKNVVEYFNELLQTSLFTYKITLANNFNHSLLKKRVTMVTKKIKTIERLIPIFILPLLVLVGVFFGCSENLPVKKEEPQVEAVIPDTIEQVIEEEPPIDDLFFIVEEMPKFLGRSHNDFRDYIQDNLVYPKEAKEKGIGGRVFVQFAVSSRGNVRDVKVVRGVDPLLDEEAIRVVKSSPQWTPGKQREKNVAVQFTFPITFQLSGTKVEESKTFKKALITPDI